MTMGTMTTLMIEISMPEKNTVTFTHTKRIHTLIPTIPIYITVNRMKRNSLLISSGPSASFDRFYLGIE